MLSKDLEHLQWNGKAEYATWYVGQASAKRAKRSKSKKAVAAAEAPAEASSVDELAEADGQQLANAVEINPGAGGAARS